MTLLKNLLFFPYFIYVCLWFVLLILLAFPITLVLILFPERIKNKGLFYVLKMISNIWFVAIGIIPINYHRKKINFSKNYIITPNHQSFIDAAIIYTCIPQVFKTLGKIGIEKTPFYGVMYNNVVITVDRSSVSAKALSYRKMIKELASGISLAIFPEGTFPNQPSQELLPFQNGCFSLAIQQQTDILPVLFLDSAFRMHPSKIIHCTPGWNRAVYLPPVSIQNYSSDDLLKLKQLVKNYMQTCLDYSRENPAKDVWAFAQQWLQQNHTPIT